MLNRNWQLAGEAEQEKHNKSDWFRFLVVDSAGALFKAVSALKNILKTFPISGQDVDGRN